MTNRPPIGVPRCYDCATMPLLYPGETASAQISHETAMAILERRVADVVVSGWLVEPMPGWLGWWLRTRYRIWGRWFSRGAPELQASVRSVVSSDEPTPR